MPQWYLLIRRPLSYLQTLLGVTVFTFPMKRRGRFGGRLGALTLLSLVLCYFSSRALYPAEVHDLGDSLSRLATQLLQYLLVFLTTWFSYEVSLWSALSLTAAGYCAAQLAGSVKALLRLIPAVKAFALTPGVMVLDIVCYLGSYYLLYLLFRPAIAAERGELDNRQKAMFSLAVLLLCVFNGRLTQDNMEINDISRFTESTYAVIVSFLVLVLQFGRMAEVRLREDVDTMRELVHEQHEQFHHSQQAVELVNEKYHDLKGLLEGFRGEVGAAELGRLKEKLSEYDTHVDTGSHVLDIVLAEKLALCARRGIELTAYADGTGTDFVEELELYALVGNALNNAIDAVTALDAGERYIALRLACREGVLTLHVENPYRGEVVMGETLPQSQRDARYHGFGMRSMERICEKYDGALTIRAEGGTFTLDAILLKPE